LRSATSTFANAAADKFTSANCAIGAFVNGLVNLPAFETLLGRKLAVVSWYVHWSDPFPKAEADLVAANGSTPLITWEPWVTNEAGTLASIAAGSYESYVRELFQAAKAWGGPLLLRFAHEMNGNWYPWDGEHNGKYEVGSRQYKKAWLYIYNVKKAVGADNVQLVWSPNNSDLPAEPWNAAAKYYPGDDYVDWVGLDGYNWGWERWQSFDEIFGESYAKLTALSNKPLLIGEFSSGTNEGDEKAAWITDAFTKIRTSYPRIKLFCWFNIDKERDWRLDSSPAAAAAGRAALQNDWFLGKIQH
jgi:hypothetical protein